MAPDLKAFSMALLLCLGPLFMLHRLPRKWSRSSFAALSSNSLEGAIQISVTSTLNTGAKVLETGQKSSSTTIRKRTWKSSQIARSSQFLLLSLSSVVWFSSVKRCWIISSKIKESLFSWRYTTNDKQTPSGANRSINEDLIDWLID